MAQAERLCRWWRDDALPFWLERAWDRQHGGFYESLTFDGTGVAGDTRRVRTQARQVYVFARAQFEGWAESLDLARAGMVRLRKLAHEPDGRPGWVHSIDERGVVLSDTRDLYDHAFILLAHAWLYRASGEAAYLDQANALLEFLDVEMSALGAGYRESIGGPDTPRRQNPHMHLFEALLALYEASGNPDHRRRLDELYALLIGVFFRPDTGMLYEYFADDWGALSDDNWGFVEPGHLVEWIWLLKEYARVTATAIPAFTETLWDTVLACGLAAETDSLITAIDANGRVRLGGSRCWMQTEWVRAAAWRLEQGRPGAQQVFDRSISSLFKNHLDSALLGGWMDAIDAHGQGCATKMPASTLYHVLGAVIEAGNHREMPNILDE